ncbi:hypothetical protein LWI28_000896 [Acer negundo]|uniref:tRNA(Phe) (4-demethylwyosine(37)-C(7)) aminocarboxypropyltransferase n=1 Tax=Acer negundo TaxID=4023 RepID=A0AAD5JEZ5_ACENE|nr:hypothetical protein LWI28_000896 [Acer negundo]
MLRRHRHAAAVVGSKIYVFGGLTDNAISSSLHVLDTDNLQWKELSVGGEWPCARHSHSMVAYGSQIYMFGGYNGEKILGDLYSFDVHKCLRKKEEVAGKSPHTRFSHSMFLYKNYLGVIGGCPVGQHDQPAMLLEQSLVCEVDRKYAKLGKDILKKFGWLDLVRRFIRRGDGTHIRFPITENFCVVFHEKQHHFGDKSEALNTFKVSKPFTGEGILLNEISPLTALNLLKECGATKHADDVVEVKRASKAPLNTMTEAVASLVQRVGGMVILRWERLGDIVVLAVTAFKDPAWHSIGNELWPIIAKSLNTSRLARQVSYVHQFMENLSEKLRMARLDCTDEVIVDLFAGIGYFVLPFLDSFPLHASPTAAATAPLSSISVPPPSAPVSPQLAQPGVGSALPEPDLAPPPAVTGLDCPAPVLPESSDVSSVSVLDQPVISPAPPVPIHPMTTRFRDGIRQPKVCTDGNVRYPLSEAHASVIVGKSQLNMWRELNGTHPTFAIL